MAEDIGTLVARVIADTEQFRSEMLKLSRQTESNTARVNTALGKIDRGVQSMGRGFQMVTRFAAAFGVALSARAIASFVTRTVEAAAQLHDLSQRLDISVESLSELQHVANITGVGLDQVTKSLQFMTRTIGEAASGNKAARTTFAMLGADLAVLQQLTLDQQFEAMAEALSRVTNESQRTALAQEVFSRGGIEMLQMTEGGVASVRALREEMRKIGVTTTEQAAAADEAKDAMDRLKASANALSREFTIGLIPAITDAIKWWREFLFTTDVDELMRARLRVKDLQDQVDEFAKNPVKGWLFGNRLMMLLKSAKLELLDMELAAPLSGRAILPPAAGPVPGLRAGALELSEADTARSSAEFILPMEEARQAAIGEMMKETFAERQEVEQATTDLVREHLVMRLEAAKAAFALEAEARLVDAEQRLELGVIDAEQFREIALQTFAQREEIEQQTTDLVGKHYVDRVAAAEDAARQEIAVRQAVAQQEIAMRELVTNSTIGLLSALGAKHRGAAIAALAIQKTLAVKEILIQSQVAQMRALAELGPIAGAPVAAAIAVKGKISAALVAATALVEAAQISGGGTSSTLGTSANPVFTQSGAAGTGAATNRSKSAVQVIFNGPIYGWDEYIRTRVVASLREAMDGRDVVIFGPNSRQAQILLGT